RSFSVSLDAHVGPFLRTSEGAQHPGAAKSAIGVTRPRRRPGSASRWTRTSDRSFHADILADAELDFAERTPVRDRSAERSRGSDEEPTARDTVDGRGERSAEEQAAERE